MRKSIPLHWSAQAEARSVREQATLLRAESEPHISILHTRTRPVWFNWLRERLWTSASTATGTRSYLSAEEDVDRVLVTILITDIVDSTRRVAEIGDRAWRALLDRHDDATRCQIKRFGGWKVGNRGDGFVSIFDSPARAVRCAASIAETIAPLGILVRCGIHLGEVDLKAAGEISGIAVHIAARIAAKASPGEAVVSKAVYDLVAGSALVFEDRGIHQLRGLPKEIQLYAMRAVDEAANTSVVDFKNRMRA
jgi:class 3 adenylate cyclase